MARTIRKGQDRNQGERHYFPSKRARKDEKRSTRQAVRRELQGYAR